MTDEGETERFGAKVNSLVDAFYKVAGVRGSVNLDQLRVFAVAGISIAATALAHMPEAERKEVHGTLLDVLAREIADRVERVAKKNI